jgi:hypothetical protein
MAGWTLDAVITPEDIVFADVAVLISPGAVEAVTPPLTVSVPLACWLMIPYAVAFDPPVTNPLTVQPPDEVLEMFTP